MGRIRSSKEGSFGKQSILEFCREHSPYSIFPISSRKILWGPASQNWTPTFISFACERSIDVVLVFLVLNLNRCVPIGLLPASFRFKYSCSQISCFPLDRRHKLNVHKTMFNLRAKCPGEMLFFLFWVPFWFLFFWRRLSSPIWGPFIKICFSAILTQN